MTRRSLVRVVAVAAAYKSAENLVVLGAGLWWLTGAPLLVGALLSVRRPRAGMLVVAAAAMTVNLTPAYRNHVHLLMLLALTLALFDDERTERWVLRCQLSIMYAFAALAKVNAEWLSGDTLGERTWVGDVLPSWMLPAAAVGTVVVEAAVAAGVWSRRREWLWAAAAMHAVFLAGVPTSPQVFGHLVLFGGVSVAVWLRASPARTPEPGRSPATAPAGWRG